MSTIYSDKQFTLGEFIDALAKLDESAVVRYDFGYMEPTSPASYRGFNDHLAFGHQETEYPKEVKVRDVLQWAREALYATYEGYKGGTYMMRENTPLWVANYSQCAGTAIVGVKDLGYGYVIIETAHVEV